MPTAPVVEGWTYDPADPSVGLFNAFWTHDTCEDGEVADEVVDRTRKETGEVTLTVRLTCGQCQATTTVFDYDFDPEEDM